MKALRLGLALAMLMSAVAWSQSPSAAAPLTADAIMASVAANQDRANQARARYVFVQHARVSSRRGSKVLCDEVTDTRVTPEPKGVTMHLVRLAGHATLHGKPIAYDHLLDQEARPDAKAPSASGTTNSAPPDSTRPQNRQRGESKSQLKSPAPSSPEADHASAASDEVDLGDNLPMDVDLVEHLRKSLLYSDSKDGIDAGLFPLTTAALKEYQYHLVGEEQKNGHGTYHITFTPKDSSDAGWRGDAWIDRNAFEPVFVQTRMAHQIPFAVRALLGTNVPGLGFSVVYAPGPDGIWFPQSFGSEFRIRVLFLFARTITVSADNRDFEQTHVSSRILPAAQAASVQP